MRRKSTETIVGRRKFRHGLGMLMSVCAMAFGIAFLVWILYTLVVNGVGALNWALFSETTPPPGEDGGGLWNAIVGTVLMVGRHDGDYDAGRYHGGDVSGGIR